MLIMTLLKIQTWGWRDSPVLRASISPCRVPAIGSSQPPLPPAPRDPKPHSGLCMYRHTVMADTHAHQ